MQADLLARYKPVIDVNSLIPKLKQLNDSAADALERLSSARHIVLYYEDLVQNRSVSSLCHFMLHCPHMLVVCILDLHLIDVCVVLLVIISIFQKNNYKYELKEIQISVSKISKLYTLSNCVMDLWCYVEGLRPIHNIKFLTVYSTKSDAFNRSTHKIEGN